MVHPSGQPEESNGYRGDEAEQNGMVSANPPLSAATIACPAVSTWSTSQVSSSDGGCRRCVCGTGRSVHCECGAIVES